MTLDQRRASFALACVRRLQRLEDRQEYRAYVRRFPATVIRAGLGQALALELAQAGDGAEDHQALLCHISAWLVAPNGWGTQSPYHRPDASATDDFANTLLIQAIIGGTEGTLIRAQGETMAYLKWLKVFSEALIPPRDIQPRQTRENAG